MRAILTGLGGAVLVTIYPRLPFVAKAALVVGVTSLAAIELNKDYCESFYASAVHGGAAAEGDAKTADLKAALHDLAENKPVPGATATAAANLAEHSAAAQERQAIADAATQSENELLAKLKRHVKLTAAENLRLSEIRQRRAEATTAELAAQAAAAWQPFNLRLAHEMANPRTVPGEDMFGFFEQQAEAAGRR
jgi:hypothetical protein